MTALLKAIYFVSVALWTVLINTSVSGETLSNNMLQTKTFDVEETEQLLQVWSLPNDDQNNGILSLVAVTARSPIPNFEVIDVRKEGRIFTLLGELKCRSPVALSNGGFYFEDDAGFPQPLGLVISAGQKKNDFRRRKFGGFAVLNKQRVDIIPVDSVSAAREAYQAIQSSPILVYRGQNDMFSDRGVKFNRTAIGITDSGNVVLLGAFRPRGSAVSLYEFAELIVSLKLHGGPRIEAALALDGGPSSQIIIPETGDIFGYDGPNYLPNAICLNVLQ